jgi:hypothetical protein
MESSRVPSSAPGNTSLTRALCLLILLLMIGAVVYGAAMAIRYFGRIGV